MNSHAYESDHSRSTSQPSPSLASWYTQGRSDGLGDRLLMTDNTGAESLELLRFHPSFAGAFGFERALREQVERLDRFHHAAFPRVRAVEYLDDGDALALVATHVSGTRLSEMFRSECARPAPNPGGFHHRLMVLQRRTRRAPREAGGAARSSSPRSVAPCRLGFAYGSVGKRALRHGQGYLRGPREAATVPASCPARCRIQAARRGPSRFGAPIETMSASPAAEVLTAPARPAPVAETGVVVPIIRTTAEEQRRPSS
jgi:hypothetical protein